jgi:hypothetical protein
VAQISLSLGIILDVFPLEVGAAAAAALLADGLHEVHVESTLDEKSEEYVEDVQTPMEPDVKTSKRGMELGPPLATAPRRTIITALNFEMNSYNSTLGK